MQPSEGLAQAVAQRAVAENRKRAELDLGRGGGSKEEGFFAANVFLQLLRIREPLSENV